LKKSSCDDFDLKKKLSTIYCWETGDLKDAFEYCEPVWTKEIPDTVDKKDALAYKLGRDTTMSHVPDAQLREISVLLAARSARNLKGLEELKKSLPDDERVRNTIAFFNNSKAEPDRYAGLVKKILEPVSGTGTLTSSQQTKLLNALTLRYLDLAIMDKDGVQKIIAINDALDEIRDSEISLNTTNRKWFSDEIKDISPFVNVEQVKKMLSGKISRT
jgi:hypothetical protein